ncbi:MAG: thioredoxin family protein [Thermoleophilia bacterium]
MTIFIVVLVVVVVLGIVVLFVPRALMAAKGAKLKGKPAPTPHKASAKRIKSGARTILYFHTPSCRACQAVDPVVNRLMKRYPGAIFKVNAATDRKAASAYGVLGVPYLAFIEGGTLVSTRTGIQKEAPLVEFLSGGAKSA